ncbi:putative U6 snRNA-associated Sm-like protein LSm4 [Vitis vinifera]|uniref:Putative U6 snRNA-associated Sm-like protein LSm4 n=1 Tax=Vitis vinifera TaxID=29760 RepID=A0A438HF72_VITVI|nr:putative U6 snRNA-associated Sm-like protein LSm4 [Vitis vinifera]
MQLMLYERLWHCTDIESLFKLIYDAAKDINITTKDIDVIDKVQEETKNRADRKPPGVGRGRGRGREEGAGGRPAKGIGRGIDEGAKGMGGGRGRGGPGGRSGGSRGGGRGRG